MDHVPESQSPHLFWEPLGDLRLLRSGELSWAAGSLPEPDCKVPWRQDSRMDLPGTVRAFWAFPPASWCLYPHHPCWARAAAGSRAHRGHSRVTEDNVSKLLPGIHSGVEVVEKNVAAVVQINKRCKGGGAARHQKAKAIKILSPAQGIGWGLRAGKPPPGKKIKGLPPV